MDIRIIPKKLEGSITLPSSKALVQRVLLLAALADKPTRIHCTPFCRDSLILCEALAALGADVAPAPYGVVVTPPVRFKTGVHITAGDNATALRLLLPLLAAKGVEARITMSPGLGARPHQPLIDCLTEGGAHIDRQGDELFISGRLQPGVYSIRGDISSQYISGLLLALPLLEGSSKIVIEGKPVSQGYIALTRQMQESFAAPQKGYDIEPGRYRSPGDAYIEGDWSLGAFWLAAGAARGDITCLGLNKDSAQGDSRIRELLLQMGGDIEWAQGRVWCRASALKGADIEGGGIPDLLPLLCLLMGSCALQGSISGVTRLKYKESDRLAAVETYLKSMGSACSLKDDRLYIRGAAPRAGEFCGFSDHRMIMSLAALSCTFNEPFVIKGAEWVDKSYPDFFSDFTALGGEYHVL